MFSYNKVYEGFSEIQELISELGLEADENFLNLTRDVDKNRLYCSLRDFDHSITRRRWEIKANETTHYREMEFSLETGVSPWNGRDFCH